jgi:predicted phosphodiesterase
VLIPSSTPLPTPSATVPAIITASIEPTQPTQTPTAIPPLRFAVIGDYGSDKPAEYDVAQLVKSWSPDLIITTGDNNYPDGSALTIDQTIGQYYQAYIHPYTGIYGEGATENNFFPSMGNHDWIPEQAQPYLDYFTLPGNERYYQFSRGPVTFFVLDSDAHEPDGVNRSSVQAEWLKTQMALSTTPWNIVYFHHPPYSSAYHGSIMWMRWPFQEWGADLVLSGHDHTYERLQVDGLNYIVNGLGGGSIYNFFIPLPESVVRYNEGHGAMLIEADPNAMHIQFFNLRGEVMDGVTITPSP